MKFKILFLLPAVALALAIGLTNCAKDPISTSPNPDTPAVERAPCVVTITTNGNAELCGTQTNMNYCSNAWNANQYGVENVAGGTHIYTIDAPSVIGVNNPGAGSLKVSITTTAGNVNFLLAGGGSRKYFVDATCGLTQI